MVKRRRNRREFTQQNTQLNNSSRKMFRRIRDGVESGESGASMLRRFRGVGLHIGNEEFYKAVRLAKAYRESGATVKRARLDTVIDDSRIPLIPEHTVMRGNYQYIVKLTANKKDQAGEIKTTFLTVKSAQGISRRRINENAAFMVEANKEKDKERYEFVGDDFKIEIIEAFRRI